MACGILLYLLFSLYAPAYLVLSAVFGDYYPYFTWVYIPILYPVTIVMVKTLVGTKRKYDLYFRGFSVYFVLAILAYTILSSA